MDKVSLTLICFLALLFNLSAQSIHRTACQGNVARLDSLLINTSIDVKDDRGRSLLHWAVACKKEEVFNFLIDKGINTTSVDNQGKTPMHVAVQFNNEVYVNRLISVQSNNDWQSNYGASLLELAVLNKNKLLIEVLLTNGVDINSSNKRGSTALEISKRIGAKEISKCLISMGADTNLVRVFSMEGKYMGQEDPGVLPKMFAPNFISTEEQEFGSIFNSKGTEFFFGVSVNGKNEIRYSKMNGNHWTKPKTIFSHERYGYNDPFLSNDETRLYFISKRALDGVGELKDVDIWYAEKVDNGWSEPINAGLTINTSGNEYYISFTNNGTMYFSSNGHTRADIKRTDYDIYYAKFIDEKFQKPVALEETINTENYEADVFVSPDESYIIFCSIHDEGFGRGDLYISFKDSNGKWSKSVNMGERINTKQYEYCPFVTKDGKYLFYTSNQDIYWVSTDIIKEMKEKSK